MAVHASVKRLLLAVSKGIWVFSLLVWLYIAVDVHIWPQTLTYQYQLAVLVPIREDFMAVISFMMAGTSFIVWEYLRHE